MNQWYRGDPRSGLTYYSFYGVAKGVSPNGTSTAMVFRPSRVGGGVFYAQIVAIREYLINAKHVVLSGSGVVLAPLSIMLAHYNPAVPGSGRGLAVDASANARSRSVAALYALHEAMQGIALGGGSKIGPDGPVDEFWVVGRIDSIPIVSDVLVTGIFGSDLVAGAEFRLSFVP